MNNIGRYLMSVDNVAGMFTRKSVEIAESLFGPIYARRHYIKSRKMGHSFQAGLIELNKRWPGIKSTSTEKPIFIFSAGWRSGSTLFQRLLMSEDPILIWGEPFSHARIISHLAHGISSITTDWPEDDWIIDKYDLENLDSTFVANLYPDIHEMQNACLAYLDTLLKKPALDKGYNRWGIKDVRLTIDDAHFLKWLYPDAKFIFLCRNPYNAYKSYRLARNWYFEWPDQPVFTAKKFGQNWAKLVEGFQNGVKEIGGEFVRYEDLCSGKINIPQLEEYLEIKIDGKVLENKVGSHRRKDDSVPKIEMIMLSKEVRRQAKLLGYQS